MGVKWFWVHQKKRKMQEDEQQLDHYFEKDDAGLYPWETDIDDSPTRVKEIKDSNESDK
jgi:hypothetical protein